MAGGKLPPRQKMIGMMYLVLTALLAMNVSKSILDAFVIVNEGLERTNENFEKKNEKTYQDFQAALGKDQAKVQPYFDRAQKAKKLSKELIEYIEKMKKHVIEMTDKKEKAIADTLTLKYVDAKDNYDIPTDVLIGSEPASPKTGDMTALDLKNKVGVYRDELVKIFKDDKLFLPADIKEMETKIKGGLELPDGVENGVKAGWEVVNFFHLPLAAVITNFSALEAQVRNAEADVVQKLLGAVKGKDFTFDRLVAKVIAPTSYLIQGDEYKADVLLVAYNSSSSPKIYTCPVDTTKFGDVDPRLNKSDPGKELPVQGGLGKYKVGTSGTGEQKWSGVIQVEKPGGGFQYYPFASSYMVAPPALVVSPTKMNVFYIGVENPVEVSVPGYATENVIPSITAGCTISPDPAKKGSYLVKCNSGTKEAKITVSVKEGGKTRPMKGEIPFRVKTLPDPIAKVGTVEGSGEMSKSLLTALQGVGAIMKNFDFALKVTVSSFTVTTSVAGDFKSVPASGNAFTGEQMSLLQKVKNNGRVMIEDIKVRMPDGTTRNLGTLTIKVKG